MTEPQPTDNSESPTPEPDVHSTGVGGDASGLSPRATAGFENVTRQKSKLRRCPAAITYLHRLGLNDETIDKYHLGIREPFRRRGDHLTVTNALAFPIMGRDGKPKGKYMMYNMPGITVNPVSESGWCVGSPVSYWSEKPDGDETLIVIEDCKDLWLFDQQKTASGMCGIVAVCSSRGREVPRDWLEPEFWTRWELICVAYRSEAGEEIARKITRSSSREIRLFRLSQECSDTWRSFFESGCDWGDDDQHSDSSSHLSGHTSAHDKPSGLEKLSCEDYPADPVNINGAFVGGHLYYPFTVEHRSTECNKARDGSERERQVVCYKTKVVRSDGAVLEVELLPAPRGTSKERRVLALTDGTRIESDPRLSHHSSWRLDSIKSYVDAMRRGLPPPHRPLSDLLSDAETHLRNSVWLPHQEDYVLLSTYIALSYVYQVFPAIPLIMVKGEKGTGKTELGLAVAAASFNAVVIGQGSAASIVRLLNETRGLAVIDDVESLSSALEKSFSDLNQMLKLSYKKQTGRKVITVANGRTVAYDFYGPKVITNTRGVDHTLGSRMLHIITRKISGSEYPALAPAVDLVRLRNEFHIWGMANANAIADIYKNIGGKSDRSDEIVAPLITIASLANNSELSDTIEKVLYRQSLQRGSRESSVDVLVGAVSNCILKGASTELTAAQLALELKTLAEEWRNPDEGAKPIWLRSEWIGQRLKALGIRDKNSPVRRTRLHGKLTRVYRLNPEYVREVLDRNFKIDTI